ncbi:MAG: hypothetical protein ABI609_05535 [Acidobacteriota bacterium]
MSDHQAAARRRAWLALLALLVPLSLLVLVACGPPKPIEVIYYYKTGSEGLAARLAGVAALSQEFPGRVTTRTVEAGSAEAQRDLERLEIGTSGLVVRNSRSVLIYKQGDVAFSIPHTREEIRRALGLPPG